VTIFPEFEQELVELARRSGATPRGGPRAVRRPRPAWLRKVTGSAPAIGATIVAIVVAAMALTLLDQGHRASHTTPPAASTPNPAQVTPARSDPAQPLTSTLAVLRRPQNAADKTLPDPVARHLSNMFGSEVQVVPGLTRLVATLRGNGLSRGVQVYFVVVTSPAGRSDKLVEIMLQGMGGGIAPPLSASQLYRPPSAIPGVGVVSATGRAYYWSSIVPNEVRRVRWVFKTRPTRTTPAKPVTVYPTIDNNLATAPVIIHPTTSAVNVTWYGHHGHVLAAFHYPGY